jgi:hypothetical protein
MIRYKESVIEALEFYGRNSRTGCPSGCPPGDSWLEWMANANCVAPIL